MNNSIIKTYNLFFRNIIINYEYNIINNFIMYQQNSKKINFLRIINKK
jgi:hypothetical protein